MGGIMPHKAADKAVIVKSYSLEEIVDHAKAYLATKTYSSPAQARLSLPHVYQRWARSTAPSSFEGPP
jgi:hypothetical protein